MIDNSVEQLRQEIEQLKSENIEALRCVQSQRDENERLKAALIEMEVDLNKMSAERQQLVHRNQVKLKDLK